MALTLWWFILYFVSTFMCLVYWFSFVEVKRSFAKSEYANSVSKREAPELGWKREEGLTSARVEVACLEAIERVALALYHFGPVYPFL